jgi:hypothetical protein
MERGKEEQRRAVRTKRSALLIVTVKVIWFTFPNHGLLEGGSNGK